tara:strand:+ start:231 stop:431 length:201 start_codon:yes stop_codon:yes gene_type:complete
MNTIKFTSKTTMKLNKKPYKGYLIGDLPMSFGFNQKFDSINEYGENKFIYGASKWFNYKGLTWIRS